jgi:hypothetical protein
LVQGKELTAFNKHQRGGHHQKLAGHFQIKLPHHVHILDELGRDLGQVHLINVHFLLLDQIKQEIERPLKYVQLNFVIGHTHTRPVQISRTHSS